MWRSLSKVWPLLHENILWSVGDGKSINCLRDPWIPKFGPLCKRIPPNSTLDMECTLVIWLLRIVIAISSYSIFWVSDDVIRQIVGVPPPQSKLGVDRIIWGGTTFGSFSIKNVYGKIQGDSWNSKEVIW